jgi:hypothetical protein
LRAREQWQVRYHSQVASGRGSWPAPPPQPPDRLCMTRGGLDQPRVSDPARTHDVLGSGHPPPRARPAGETGPRQAVPWHRPGPSPGLALRTSSSRVLVKPVGTPHGTRRALQEGDIAPVALHAIPVLGVEARAVALLLRLVKTFLGRLLGLDHRFSGVIDRDAPAFSLSHLRAHDTRASHAVSPASPRRPRVRGSRVPSPECPQAPDL